MKVMTKLTRVKMRNSQMRLMKRAEASRSKETEYAQAQGKPKQNPQSSKGI